MQYLAARVGVPECLTGCPAENYRPYCIDSVTRSELLFPFIHFFQFSKSGFIALVNTLILKLEYTI